MEFFKDNHITFHQKKDTIIVECILYPGHDIYELDCNVVSNFFNNNRAEFIHNYQIVVKRNKK